MHLFRNVLAGLLLLSISTLQAQLSLGLKAGVNLAQQNIKDVDLDLDSDEINGYTWGAFLEIPLGSGNVALQPEFLLIQKGGDLNLNVSQIKTTINYIDVPILLKLKLINANLFNVNLFGGPSLGYATSGETLENSTVIKLNFGNDNIQRFDLGIQTGGGVGIHLGSLTVFGDARYVFGISDVDGGVDRTIKNRGITISAGLQFRLVGR